MEPLAIHNLATGVPAHKDAAPAAPVGATEPFASKLHDALGAQNRERDEEPSMALWSTQQQVPVVLTLDDQLTRLGEPEARAVARLLWETHVQGQERGATVTARLAPESLGDLELTIAMEGDRQVHVTARASDPQVARLLTNSRQELATALARWGLVLARFDCRERGMAERSNADEALAREAVQQPASEADETVIRRSFFEVVI